MDLALSEKNWKLELLKKVKFKVIRVLLEIELSSLVCL
jgi:hypothetical protein